MGGKPAVYVLTKLSMERNEAADRTVESFGDAANRSLCPT